MKIELLYVAGCPSRSAAIKLIEDAMRAEGITPEISEVLVSSHEMAEKLRFCGSPTVRINGQDIAGERREKTIGLRCLWSPDLLHPGLPLPEIVRNATAEARNEPRRRGK